MAIRARLVGVVFGVDVDKLLETLSQIVQSVNGVRFAHWHASPTINATHRIDEQLLSFFKARLIFLGVNAVCGADVGTEQVFRAGIDNYICHKVLQIKEVVLTYAVSSRSGCDLGHREKCFQPDQLNAPYRSSIFRSFVLRRSSAPSCPGDPPWILKESRSFSSEDKAANVRQVGHSSRLHIRYRAGVQELN